MKESEILAEAAAILEERYVAGTTKKLGHYGPGKHGYCALGAVYVAATGEWEKVPDTDGCEDLARKVTPTLEDVAYRVCEGRLVYEVNDDCGKDQTLALLELAIEEACRKEKERKDGV